MEILQSKEQFAMPRLLCVGNEPKLLQTRCAVLESAGHGAQGVMLEEAESLLRMSEFDLAIISAWLSDEEKGRILSVVGETPTLVLTEMTFADDLLARVELMLQHATSANMRGASNPETSTADQNI